MNFQLMPAVHSYDERYFFQGKCANISAFPGRILRWHVGLVNSAPRRFEYTFIRAFVVAKEVFLAGGAARYFPLHSSLYIGQTLQQQFTEHAAVCVKIMSSVLSRGKHYDDFYVNSNITISVISPVLVLFLSIFTRGC